LSTTMVLPATTSRVQWEAAPPLSVSEAGFSRAAGHSIWIPAALCGRRWRDPRPALSMRNNPPQKLAL
jgi:hypothetical protein